MFLSFVSLTVTSFALAFGVFSATTRAVTINGTISYVANEALVQIASTITNGFEDDDENSNLEDINTTRSVTVRNFTAGTYVQEDFSVYSGNGSAFILDNRWNVGNMYFNPSSNVVASDETPDIGEVSVTVELVMVISNYSTFPVSVTVTTLQDIINPISSIQTDGIIGYDLTDASIASISASNVARSNVSSATSKIYFKLNDLGVDLSSLNFGFKVQVSKIS